MPVFLLLVEWDEPRSFVRGLQLCATKARGGKDEVRGLRLWPARVGPAGKVVVARPAMTPPPSRGPAARPTGR